MWATYRGLLAVLSIIPTPSYSPTPQDVGDLSRSLSFSVLASFGRHALAIKAISMCFCLISSTIKFLSAHLPPMARDLLSWPALLVARLRIMRRPASGWGISGRIRLYYDSSYFDVLTAALIGTESLLASFDEGHTVTEGFCLATRSIVLFVQFHVPDGGKFSVGLYILRSVRHRFSPKISQIGRASCRERVF